MTKEVMTANKAVAEAVEVAVNEALEAKTVEIEEKADSYIAEALEAKTKEIEDLIIKVNNPYWIIKELMKENQYILDGLGS